MTVAPLQPTSAGLPKRARQDTDNRLAVVSPKRARGEVSPWASPCGSDASWLPDSDANSHALLRPTNDIEMCNAPPAEADCVPGTLSGHDPIICYGCIGRLPPSAPKNTSGEWECLAKLDRDCPKTSLPKKSAGYTLCFPVRAELDSSPLYRLYTNDNVKLGMLDHVTGKRLKSLCDIPGLLIQAVVRSIDVKNGKSARGMEPIPVSVNVLGPESCAMLAGDKLAEEGAYLQHPYFLDRDFEYSNPQFWMLTGTQAEYMTHLIGIDEDSLASKALSDEISGVMDSLSAGELAGKAQFDDIATELKPHQRQGVEFILKRENPEHCHNVGRNVCIMTGSNPSAAATSSMGGIIADVMGMGKTLTTISAIVATKLESRQSVAHQADATQGYTPGPTLVVLPSVQLMNVWQTEIQTHVKPEAQIVVSEFHGPKRPRNVQELMAQGSDVVLTTFSTLAEDSKKGKKSRVLQNVTWFRVVLDEAHWIRNQVSQRSKAAKALVSERRWCLTGTPVQNSLNDLASLINFLNIQPFAQPAEFRSRILTPLSNEDDRNRCQNLRTLLSAICLRRGAKCLDLPRAREELVYVDQTEDEKEAQTRALKACQARMENLVSGNGRGAASSTRKYNIMFDVMMQLRRLCNNGTFRPSVGSQVASQKGPKEILAINDPDSGPCEQCDGGEMAKSGEEYCSMCERKLGPWAQSEPGTPISVPSPGLDDATLRQPSLMAMETLGRSSKLEKVVENIRALSPGDKSIVFSTWTSTLNILEQLLDRRGLRYVRIDGAVKASDRTGIIERFSQDPEITVILLTIGCGAVGLTITAANRVHLVEPQWNPSVEEQAVARAVRMGQEREVVIFRYVVKGSIEKSIMDLQKKKSHLAQFTIDGTDDRMSGKLEDLRFMLNLPA